MPAYAIMREPGAAAKLRAAPYSHPRPKRLATVEAPSEKEALARFMQRTYVTYPHRQYVGSMLRWKAAWRSRAWRDDDGDDKQGRHWIGEVTLRNGRAEHVVRLYAWRL